MSEKRRYVRLDIKQLDKDILRVSRDFERINIRQIYYRLVSSKRYSQYKGRPFYEKVQRRILKLRKKYLSLDRKIADRSRYLQTGRSNVWLLVEKEAVYNVVESLAEKYQVNLMALRGFPSQTALNKIPKDALILLLTDFDPSGLAIRNQIKGNVEILAVNKSQISKFHLVGFQIPARDTRAKKFRERFGELGYELESFRPNTLRKIVSERLARLPKIRRKGLGTKSQKYSKKQLSKMSRKELIQIIQRS